MIKQYDIIKLKFDVGDYRPCLVISDSILTEGVGFAWIMPILTNKEAVYPTDVTVEGNEGVIRGVIDSLHIHSVNLNQKDYHTVDVLNESKVKEIKDVLSGVLNI